MPGLLCDHSSQERPSNQCKIANQVQGFMTAGFVRETHPPGIHHLCPVETDRVFKRGASDQSHVPHLFQLIFEPKRAGRSNFPGIDLRRNLKIQALLTHLRVIEIDMAGEFKPV